MKSLFSKEVLGHPIVLASLGAVVVIAAASGLYYVSSTRVPSVDSATEASATAAVVTGNGTVEPAQNPDLAFASGGRVTRIPVAVGDKVSQGQLLASLDTAALSAQRAQAAANLKSQQAKFNEMKAGARQVDVSAKQTAVSQAQLTLSNAYQNVAATLSNAYGQSSNAVHTDSDALFDNPNANNPSMLFTISNAQAGLALVNKRIALNLELPQWQSELTSLSSQSSPAQLDAALASSLSHMISVREYASYLLTALNNAVPSNNFTQAQITAALSPAGTLLNTVNGLVTSLQSTQQTLAADKLAVQSAQDALNQTLAGSTPQEIEAQQAQVDAAAASVANVDAQIANATVVAPFSGTVASVHVKKGDIVPPNTAAVSLNPTSALQIIVYFSEIDITKIRVGQVAQATLDAYGNSRVFPAQVVEVDTSPTQTGGNTTGYKATLQFAQTDPAVSSGMTANVTIPISQ